MQGGIQKLTGRYTYNFGISSRGATAALALLKKEEKRHLIPISHTPEYVIYTYMFHHPQRFREWQFYNLLRKEKLIPFQKYNILYNSLTYQLKKNIEVDNYFSDDINVEKRMNLFFLTMQAIKKQSDKIFPDSKFILLIYSDVNNDLCDGFLNSVDNDTKQIEKLFEIMNSNEFRKRIEKLGIQVISTEELIGRKMYKKEDRIPHIKGQEPFDPNHPHPSASAWNEILPALVNKMNL